MADWCASESGARTSRATFSEGATDKQLNLPIWRIPELEETARWPFEGRKLAPTGLATLPSDKMGKELLELRRAWQNCSSLRGESR